MSDSPRRPLAEALNIASSIVAELGPYCEQIEIAGSIRRQRPTIGDIEIVCVPAPYDSSPLFRSGIALIVDQWEKVRGELPCRYTQRLHPSGMKVDLFMPDPRGFGLQLAIRTGSADWCKQVLAPAWARAGYRSHVGILYKVVNLFEGLPGFDGPAVPTRTECELFELIGLPWVEPVDREVQP
jgi:DNA polymerase/3'-5' exonuclease PolX